MLALRGDITFEGNGGWFEIAHNGDNYDPAIFVGGSLLGNKRIETYGNPVILGGDITPGIIFNSPVEFLEDSFIANQAEQQMYDLQNLSQFWGELEPAPEITIEPKWSALYITADRMGDVSPKTWIVEIDFDFTPALGSGIVFENFVSGDTILLNFRTKDTNQRTIESTYIAIPDNVDILWNFPDKGDHYIVAQELPGTIVSGIPESTISISVINLLGKLLSCGSVIHAAQTVNGASFEGDLPMPPTSDKPECEAKISTFSTGDNQSRLVVSLASWQGAGDAIIEILQDDEWHEIAQISRDQSRGKPGNNQIFVLPELLSGSAHQFRLSDTMGEAPHQIFEVTVGKIEAKKIYIKADSWVELAFTVIPGWSYQLLWTDTFTSSENGWMLQSASIMQEDGDWSPLSDEPFHACTSTINIRLSEKKESTRGFYKLVLALGTENQD
ncbi:MAG: choice-of-anchor A family protein [Lentisphaerae bacterium]|nr:choice-of-anchor A family protein [Lentisphaerota bacterium]